jgi:hypothetical protein
MGRERTSAPQAVRACEKAASTSSEERQPLKESMASRIFFMGVIIFL